MSSPQQNIYKTAYQHGSVEPLMQTSYQEHGNDGNHNSSNDDDTDTSSNQPDEEDQNWIPWFCRTKGNDFFCEVERVFIEDSFNLFGIKQDFPFDISVSLAIILDKAEYEEENSHEQGRAAELLYGMIHARYLLSSQGLIAMHRKFVAKGFGECPRTCCNGQAALPVGLSDEVGMTPVKLFCPRCRDIYNCPTQPHVDGAFFGTTFPHLFLMTFENLVPSAPTHHYVPRVFGFRIHQSSQSIAKVDSGDRLQHLSLSSSHAPTQAQSHVPLLLQSSSQTLTVSEVGNASAAGANSTSRDEGNNNNRNSARQANPRNSHNSNTVASSSTRGALSSSRATAFAVAMDVDGDDDVAQVKPERLPRPRTTLTSAASSSRVTRNRNGDNNNNDNNSNNNNSSLVVVPSSSARGPTTNNNNNLQILSEVSATQEQNDQGQQQQQVQPAQKKARKS